MGKILAGSLDLQQVTTSQANPAAGYNKLYMKSDGFLYTLDASGVESRVAVGGSKVSALPAVTTPAGTDEFPVNQSGTSKKMTLTQINAYAEPISSSATASQTGFAAEALLAGSALTIVPSRLQAGTFYRCIFHVTKTAAGVAAPLINIRMGTTGTATDASRATLTLGAQTAVADEGEISVYFTYRAVGASANFVWYSKVSHRLATTGLSTTATNSFFTGTSTTFDSTTLTKIGLYLTAGTSASWTVPLVQSDLLNII